MTPRRVNARMNALIAELEEFQGDCDDPFCKGWLGGWLDRWAALGSPESSAVTGEFHTTGPIRIRCEGSGSGLQVYDNGSMCQMCGAVFTRPLSADATELISTTPEHDRDDMLAMLKRGDFG